MAKCPDLQFDSFHGNSGKELSPEFYLNTDVISIAKSLLGKVLYSCIDGQITSGFIVETEAYRGADDKACHAYPNKRTARTETMFAKGGIAYVYLCYGIHHLFNIVTGPQETANAVLIRAIEPFAGIDVINQRRNRDLTKSSTSGPGCLTSALGITTDYNEHSILDEHGAIKIMDLGAVLMPDNIIASPRIGVDYAAECAKWPWRFSVKENLWVSGRR